MDNLGSGVGVIKFCSEGGHVFLSKDRFVTCESCRQKKRERWKKKKAVKNPRLLEWTFKSEQELEELLKTLERESGYSYVLRRNKQTEIAPGKCGFYRIYACPRWNKSKLPEAPITTGLSMQEAFLAEQERYSTVHPCTRHWLRKPRLGIGCGFQLVAKTRENGDILVYQARDHLEDCCPVKKGQLAPQVQTWVRNLLHMGQSAVNMSEWSWRSPPEGIPECPKEPPDASSNYLWTPSYEYIKSVEHRMRRESYIHADDKLAVCQLLEEWSGLSSGMQRPDCDRVRDRHVLYWQNFECHCAVEEKIGPHHCYNGSANCKPFIAILQSPWQRACMMKEVSNGHGEVIGLDGSGQMLSTRWMLHTLVMINKYNIGIPIGFALSSDEDSKVVTLFLDTIASTSPPHYNPRVMMIDINLTHITAIMQSSWGKDVALRVCFARVMQAWMTWCTKMKQRHSKEILALIHSIKWAPSKSEVDGLVRAMKAWLAKEGNCLVSNHFEEEFFSKTTDAGPIAKLWVNSHRTPVLLNGISAESNSQCEDVLNALKYRFLERKVDENVGHLLKVLVQGLGPFYQSKCDERISSFPTQWTEEALRKEELAIGIVTENRVTVFDSTLGLGSVLSSKVEAHCCQVSLQPPSCTCPDTCDVLCEHIRALGRVLGGLQKWGIGMSAGYEHVGNTSRVSDPLVLNGTDFASFQQQFPLLSSSKAQLVVKNTPNKDLCSSFQRVCSNGSMNLESFYFVQKSLKRLREVHGHSDAESLYECERLLSEASKLESPEAAATLDEFEKVLWDGISNQKKTKAVSRGRPRNEASQSKRRKQDNLKQKQEQEAIQKPRDEGQAVFPGGSTGVQKVVLKEGDGKTFPSRGQTVALHYTAGLAYGPVLESSRDRGTQVEFQIGIGKVIKGLDEGVLQMAVGERAVLQCSPEFAYGTTGIPNRIPPNSTVFFDVELFKVV